ncbi:MAG: exo-alpha-sialidase [Clostridia bacterium]|nr:exo-alpha-sialidase [Clostridia bacterium]
MHGPFFYDFSDKAYTESLIQSKVLETDATTDMNTALSYDAAQQALRIEPTDFTKADADRFIIWPPNKEIPVEDYPVFAVKVKLNNPNHTAHQMMAGTHTQFPTRFRTDMVVDPYQQTEDWQVLFFDGTGYGKLNEAYTGTWAGFLLRMMAFNVIPTKEDVFFIKWIGTFATADDAYAFAGMENPKAAYSLPDPAGKGVSPFFWDLSREEVVAAHANITDGTAVSFDSAESAMKLTVTDANKRGRVILTPGRFTLGIRNPMEQLHDAAELPLLALRVKRSRADMAGGWLSFRTARSIEKYMARELNSVDYAAAQLAYPAGTDWCTVVVDLAALADITDAYAGDLKTLKLDMIAHGGAEDDDAVWVRWVGAFATMADIKATQQAVDGTDCEPIRLAFDQDAVADKNAVTQNIANYADTPITLPEGVTFPITPKMSTPEVAAKIDNSIAIATQTKIKSDVAIVSDYEPEYGYKHHGGLAWFKGKFYASYSRGMVGEDAPGQCMMVKSSEDGLNWSEPTVIGPSIDTGYGWSANISGFLYSTGERLYAYYMEHHFTPENYTPDGVWIKQLVRYLKTIRRVTYTDDGIHWSRPEVIDIASNEAPRKSLTGRWFGGAGARLITADAPNGVNWRPVGMSDAQRNTSRDRGAILTECSWFQTDDYVLHQMIRSDTGMLWLSESFDNGATWTNPEPSNFTAAVSMPNFGRLPDGRIYFVGGPDPRNRYPLVLHVSEDGLLFDKGYILRDEPYQMKDMGFGKGGEYAYPEVLIHGDYMYVLYSKQKEVMEITRVKLSDIQ